MCQIYYDDDSGYLLLGLTKLWGGHFVKNFVILVRCPRGSRKKFDWFRCEKISQKLKIQMRKERKIFFRPVLFVSPLCACPMRKISLATSEKREWKSGF